MVFDESDGEVSERYIDWDDLAFGEVELQGGYVLEVVEGVGDGAEGAELTDGYGYIVGKGATSLFGVEDGGKVSEEGVNDNHKNATGKGASLEHSGKCSEEPLDFAFCGAINLAVGVEGLD